MLTLLAFRTVRAAQQQDVTCKYTGQKLLKSTDSISIECSGNHLKLAEYQFDSDSKHNTWIPGSFQDNTLTIPLPEKEIKIKSLKLKWNDGTITDVPLGINTFKDLELNGILHADGDDKTVIIVVVVIVVFFTIVAIVAIIWFCYVMRRKRAAQEEARRREQRSSSAASPPPQQETMTNVNDAEKTNENALDLGVRSIDDIMDDAFSDSGSGINV